MDKQFKALNDPTLALPEHLRQKIKKSNLEK
jgi:hypothetical protein